MLLNGKREFLKWHGVAKTTYLLNKKRFLPPYISNTWKEITTVRVKKKPDIQ